MIERSIISTLISLILISCTTTTMVINKRIEYHKNKDRILGHEYEMKKNKIPEINNTEINLIVTKYDLIEVTETEVVTTLTKQVGLDDIKKDTYNDISVYPKRSDNGQVLKDVIFDINIFGSVKSVASDSKGEIIFDLVEDYGLDNFEKPTEIKITVQCKSINFTDTLILNSKLWTVPFVKIIKDEFVVYNEENGKLVEKGIVHRGEIFRIDFENEELYRIHFGKEPAFIPKKVGRKFWSVIN